MAEPNAPKRLPRAFKAARTPQAKQAKVVRGQRRQKPYSPAMEGQIVRNAAATDEVMNRVDRIERYLDIEARDRAAKTEQRRRWRLERDRAGPLKERLTKPDVEEYTPREIGKNGEVRKLPPIHRVRKVDEPVLAISSLSYDEKAALLHFGRVWRRATAEPGCTDYEASHGGGFNGGLTHSRAEAMDELAPMVDCLADTDEARNHKANIVIAIAGKRMTLDDVGGTGGRRRAATLHALVSCSQRIQVYLQGRG